MSISAPRSASAVFTARPAPRRARAQPERLADRSGGDSQRPRSTTLRPCGPTRYPQRNRIGGRDRASSGTSTCTRVYPELDAAPSLPPFFGPFPGHRMAISLGDGAADLQGRSGQFHRLEGSFRHGCAQAGSWWQKKSLPAHKAIGNRFGDGVSCPPTLGLVSATHPLSLRSG